MSDSWSELDDAAVLACARGEHPAFRSGAELDRIDPGALTAAERVDLLAVLEEQRRWFEAAQLRVLAAMQQHDTSQLGLAQESVSLALQIPLRTAQNKLAQARTLVSELPKTLAAIAAARSRANMPGCWPKQPGNYPTTHDSPRPWNRRCCRRCSTVAASRYPSSGSGFVVRR